MHRNFRQRVDRGAMSNPVLTLKLIHVLGAAVLFEHRARHRLRHA